MVSGSPPDRSSVGLGAVLRVLDGAGTDLDLKQVLHRATEAAIAATSADRAALLVVAGDSLSPAAVSARRPNAELFRRFRAMTAIPLHGPIDRAALLFRGRTVVVENCREGDLVPDEWLAAFGTTSVAVAPVIVPDHFAAVLAIDYTQQHRFEQVELVALEAIAQAARVAIDVDIRRGEAERSAEVHRQLGVSVSRLADARDVTEVASAVRATVAALFPEATVALELLDERTLVGRSSAVNGRRHVLKLAAGARHFGYLTFDGFPGRGDDLVVAESIANLAALAIDRINREGELADRTARAEAMQRVSEVLRAQSSPATLLVRLNRVLESRTKIQLSHLAMRQRRHVEVFRCRQLSLDEATLLARSADDRHPIIHSASRHEVHVTIPVSGRPAGVLAVATAEGLAADDESILEAIAIGIGQIARSRQLDRELSASTRLLETAGIRRRLVDDLDRRQGSTLVKLTAGLRAELAVARPGPARERLVALHDLAMQLVAEAHTFSGTLAAIAIRDVGLDVGLRDVTRSFEEWTDISVALRCDLREGSLAGAVEEGIVALVYDALSLVVRPGRCALVSVTVARGEEVVVEVRDDGAGLEHRTSIETPLGVHYAIAALRRRVQTLGGRLDVRAAQPRGVVLTARFPESPPAEADGGTASGVVLQLPAQAERPVS